MSVSNDSAAGNGARSETKREKWQRIRYRYESSDISHRDLAKAEGEPYSTLNKRAMREKWTQRGKLVAATANKLELQVNERIQTEIKQELAPWIEQQKVKFTKRGFKIASRGADRVEAMFDDDSTLDAKTESYLAKAAQTYVQIGRVSLGMGDGSAPAGSLNLNILTNQAAVQVVSQPT